MIQDLDEIVSEEAERSRYPCKFTNIFIYLCLVLNISYIEEHLMILPSNVGEER